MVRVPPEYMELIAYKETVQAFVPPKRNRANASPSRS